jgi:membrane associated rhomboid family serine protease
MNRSPLAQATSRMGPGLKSGLIVIGVVGLLQALLVNWVGLGEAWELLVCNPDLVLKGQVWRLLTAGVLTDITHPMGLIFTLAGLYFLSPDLERRWGTGRFLWFLALSVVLGNVLAIAIGLIAPETFGLLHPRTLYGANAALVGTAIAWGVNNREQQVNLFMVIPVRGQTLIWVTIGGCFLYLLYQGDVASFGGVVTGLTMVGEPSAMRRLYLRFRLAFLRGRVGSPGKVPTAADILRSKGPILRGGRDRPPLRVVQGGQAGHTGHDPDGGGERGKSDSPKDKRYLN